MIHELIAKRRSILAFDQQPIESEKLEAILEAATKAPSSYNIQPWRFIVARKGDEHYDKLLGGLVPVNREWAQHAPVLLLTIAQTEHHTLDKPNPYAWHDTALALASMTFQALSEGIFVHPMGGFNRDKVRQEFRIPKGYDPVAMAALGYPGDPDMLSKEFRLRQLTPTERIDFKKLTFGNYFGELLLD